MIESILSIVLALLIGGNPNLKRDEFAKRPVMLSAVKRRR